MTEAQCWCPRCNKPAVLDFKKDGAGDICEDIYTCGSCGLSESGLSGPANANTELAARWRLTSI